MTYEIVKVLGSEDTGRVIRESHLVRLGSPALCRGNKTLDLYEVDYVIVEALQIFDSGVEYQETHVVASSEDGNPHDAVLYQATRALTVPEAMFSIGEHNYNPIIEDVEDTNGDQAV
jgi:hypothetical protein